jgi:DNA topoisomerase III
LKHDNRVSSFDGVLSVGRVQTPTLKLIVDRDLQIESFKSTAYFDFILGFSEGIAAKWHAPETITDLDGYVTNKSHALDVKNNTENKPAVVTSYAEKELVKSPPLCFSLSALQNACMG